MTNSSEDYVSIRGRLKDRRTNAILFAVGRAVERGDWIPRSLLHGADEIKLDSQRIGDEITIRMFRWKAEELGFETRHEHEAALHDLFEMRDDC
jgi:hypothetical protein